MKKKLRIRLFNPGCDVAVAQYDDISIPDDWPEPPEGCIAFLTRSGLKVASNMKWLVEDYS